MPRYQFLPSIALSFLLTTPLALGTELTIKSSGSTISNSVHHDNIQSVVTPKCRRFWCPDIGDDLQVEMNSTVYSPGQHVAEIGAEPLKRYGRFAEPERYLDPLSLNGKGNIPLDNSTDWKNTHPIFSASTGNITHKANMSSLQDWMPSSSPGANALIEKEDKKVDDHLNSIISSIKDFTNSLVEKTQRGFSGYGDSQ